MHQALPLTRQMRTQVQFRKWESNWTSVPRHVLTAEARGFATIHGSTGWVSHLSAAVLSGHKGQNWRGLARVVAPPPIKEKPTLRGWLFFAYYRVFTRIPLDSYGLQISPFLTATGRYYSPFGHSLSHPPHPAQAEVQKARLPPLYKSTD